MLLISCESEGELMKRKGKRFLVLLTTASLSLNMLGISAFAAEDSPEADAAFVSEISKNETDLSVNRPDSEVPEVSYEPIIIDIPDGPIPAGETWDNEVSATDIAENDIPTADSFKVHLSDGSSKLWISVGVVSGAGVIFTAMCQKGNENR